MMATLTAQTFDESGKNVTFSAASAGGDQFENRSNQFVIVKNDDASAKTVTVVAQTSAYNFGPSGIVVKQNQSVSVPAGGTALLGPFPSAFKDANGNVQLTYSAVTSLSVAVVNH